jgi:hypothetical protein
MLKWKRNRKTHKKRIKKIQKSMMKKVRYFAGKTNAQQLKRAKSKQL